MSTQHEGLWTSVCRRCEHGMVNAEPGVELCAKCREEDAKRAVPVEGVASK